MLRFDANLYRIATACQSHAEMRYYLNGVFVEPCPAGGVQLTTTDGHRLICIRDETGQADESAIIALSPDALKACKVGKGEARRTVTVEGLAATVRAVVSPDQGEAGDLVAMMARCRIDGTFPDYRRVIPTVEMPSKSIGSYNGNYLGDFAKIVGELEKHFNGTTRPIAIMRVVGNDAGSPALVLFGNVSQAFGVIMPVRGDETHEAPEWFTGKKEEVPTP